MKVDRNNLAVAFDNWIEESKDSERDSKVSNRSKLEN